MNSVRSSSKPQYRHLDLAILRSFVLIAEGRTFGETALVMQRSPSAITLQIQKLEEFLGLKLLNRSGRSVSLTSEGLRLMTEVKALLALNDDLLSRFAGTTGDLTA